MPAPAGRASLIAAIYVVAYLAFSLPAIAAGVLATHLGLRPATIGYAAVAAALALASLAATRGGVTAPPRRAASSQQATAPVSPGHAGRPGEE